MALHYAEAGKILDRISAAGAKPFSLKKMLYSKPDKKVSLGVVYALVTETLKCMNWPKSAFLNEEYLKVA